MKLSKFQIKILKHLYTLSGLNKSELASYIGVKTKQIENDIDGLLRHGLISRDDTAYSNTYDGNLEIEKIFKIEAK